MVRIAISQAAFEAIAKTLPLGSVGYENANDEKGERLIWLDRAVVDRLKAMIKAKQALHPLLRHHRAQQLGGDIALQQPLAVLGKRRVIPGSINDD
jgi:hypothetical protein